MIIPIPPYIASAISAFSLLIVYVMKKFPMIIGIIITIHGIRIFFSTFKVLWYSNFISFLSVIRANVIDVMYPVHVANTVPMYGGKCSAFNNKMNGISKHAFTITPVRRHLYISLNFFIL